MADNPYLIYPDNYQQQTPQGPAATPTYGGSIMSEDDANKTLEKVQKDWGQTFSPGVQQDMVQTLMAGKPLKLDLSAAGGEDIPTPRRSAEKRNPFLIYPDDNSNESRDSSFLSTLQNHEQEDTSPATPEPTTPVDKSKSISDYLLDAISPTGAITNGRLGGDIGRGITSDIPATAGLVTKGNTLGTDLYNNYGGGFKTAADLFNLASSSTPVTPQQITKAIIPTLGTDTASKLLTAQQNITIETQAKRLEDMLNSYLPGKSVAEQNIDAAAANPNSTGMDIAKAYATNPTGLVDKIVAGVSSFAPATIPGAGEVVAPAIMGGSSMANTYHRYAMEHGADTEDKIREFYKDPANVEAAERSQNIHGATGAALGLIIPGASKVIDGLVPETFSAVQKTITKTAANLAIQPAIAVAANQGAAYAAGEKAPSLAQNMETLIQTAGYVAHPLISGAAHDFAVDNAKVKDDTGNLLNTYLDEHGVAQKADTGTTLDIKAELDKQAQAKAKDDAFKQAEQYKQEQARKDAELELAQEEADQRNQVLVNQYAGQTRLETYPDGSMERVPIHPPAGVSAEDVLEERQQAKQDEADRVQRVALGQLAERVRDRDTLTTQQKQEAQAKQDSWLKAAQTKQTNAIIDGLRSANPNATPDELAPMVQAELAKAPALIPPSSDPIVKQITNIVRGRQVAAKDKATRAQRKAIGQIVKDNPNANLQELADLYRQQQAGVQQPTTAPKADTAISATQEQAQSANTSEPVQGATADSTPTPQDITSLNMAKGDKKQEIKQPFPEVLHALVKGLVSRGGRTANDILTLGNQGKLVAAPNAESIGRDDKGAAAYDPKTGKMYIYTDHMEPGDTVGAIMRGIHEATHGGQYNEREARSGLMKMILGQEGFDAAKTKVETAAKANHKQAKEAVRLATEAATDKKTGAFNKQTYNLELMPYFAGEIARKRGGTFGRLGGVVRDMVAGSRNMLREKGFDIQPSLNDIASATQRTAGELAKTKIVPRSTGESVNMMIGEKATDAAERKAAGRGIIGGDGKWRDEIADNKAEINTAVLSKAVSEDQSLKDILPRHDELFKAYPDAKDIQVGVDQDLKDSGIYAYLHGNKVMLAPETARIPEVARSKVLHEVQHWVQEKEGFSKGGSSRQFINPRYGERAEDAKRAMDRFLTPFKLGEAVKTLPEDVKTKFYQTLSENERIAKKELPLDESKKIFMQEAAKKSSNIDVRNAARAYDKLRGDKIETTIERDKHLQEAHQKYLNLPGEVEARQTEVRSRMTPEELAANPVSSAKNELPTEPLNMAKKAEPEEDEGVSPINPTAVTKEAYQRATGLRGAVNSLFGTNPTKEIGRQMQVGWLAKHDRDYTTAERQIAQYKSYFDKMPKAQRLQIIDDWQTGKPITDPNAKAFFEAITPLYKQAIDYIRSVDPSLLKNMNERYLAQIWKRGFNNGTRDFLTKGPLAGSKAFLKARQWNTIKEGMEKGGLTPLTTNPAELTMIKLGELLKFSGLVKFREDLKARDWLQKNKLGKEPPEGWSTVNDPSFMGYIVPDVIAHDLNKNLSRGLTDVPGFRQIRKLENMMVMGKLGWSGFHAAFTTFDNLSTGFETALRRAVGGDLKGALVGALKAAGSPVMSPYEGGALIKNYLGQEPKSDSQASRWQWLAGVDEHTKALLDLIEKGGGRAFMDKSEWNNALAKQLQAFRQRDIKQGAINALPALGEASSFLIHRKLVPAQKMSARVLLLKAELDRLADKYDLGAEKGDYTGIINALHPDAAAQVARKVVNLVDDRLGHMSYDNQFWNPYLRHMAQLINIAPGWFTGTLRTIAGGVTDVRRLASPEKIAGSLDKAGKINDATFGRLTSRTSNLIVLSLLTAASSGAFMYALTGQWPQTFKDYIHPKTGRKNSDGTDERIAWPTYAKEHYALLTDPVHELGRKVNHPLLQSVYELFNNADYTNTEIYNSHGDTKQKVEDVVKYLAKGFFEPISAGNASRSNDMAALNPKSPALNSGLKVAGMFGVTPARQELDHTDLENYINKKYFASFPQAALSRAEKDRFTAKAKATNEQRAGSEPDLSDFSSKDRKDIRTNSRGDAETTTFTNRFKALRTLEDKLEAWDIATQDEKDRYKMRAAILHNAREQLGKISDKQHRLEVAQQIQQIREGQ